MSLWVKENKQINQTKLTNNNTTNNDDNNKLISKGKMKVWKKQNVKNDESNDFYFKKVFRQAFWFQNESLY